jgi:hypothetical protein
VDELIAKLNLAPGHFTGFATNQASMPKILANEQRISGATHSGHCTERIPQWF